MFAVRSGSRLSWTENWIACGFSTPVKYQLAIVPIDGGEPSRIFDSAPLANIRLGIRWTADGKSVIYRDQRVGLWQQAIDGSAPRRVPGLPPEKIYGFAWSRDNKLLAYTLGTEIRDVVLVTAANSSLDYFSASHSIASH